MLRFINILSYRQSIRIPIGLLVRNLRNGPIQVSWEKPPIGWTKLNFDGSCKNGTNKASIGGVFRNHNAEFLLGYAQSIGRTTSTVAELAALRRGLELVLENAWDNVWLEGDAMSLMEVIARRKHVKCEEMQRQVKDINLIIPKFDNCILSHIYREGNRVADRLAQIGHDLEKPGIWWHSPPDDVLRIVREDADGKILLRKR